MINPTDYTTSKDIKRAIIAARPRIESVNRIAGWGTLIFGVFNILLGLALFMFQARFSGGVSILNYILNYQFWGVVFFFSGVVITWAFLVNDWRIMRAMLAFMLSVKFIWLVALVFRFLFFRYDNILLLLMWSSLTALQVLLYLFFFPEVPAAERRIQGEELHARD